MYDDIESSRITIFVYLIITFLVKVLFSETNQLIFKTVNETVYAYVSTCRKGGEIERLMRLR